MAHSIVAVVGARALPEGWAEQVGAIVRHYLGRGWGIGSGGARGADRYALRAVVAAGPEACARSVVYLPWPFTDAADPRLRAFARFGGRVLDGSGFGRAAFLARSRRLVRGSSQVVAFLWGPSRGSVYTLREAVRAGKPAVAVLAGGGATLPAFPGGRWAPCSLAGLAAFRWVPRAPTRAAEGPAAHWPRTGLARIFVVPDGEPVHALLTHIASLTPGERLWFEHAILAGDTVLAPHERLDHGKPGRLAGDRLMRGLRCTAKAAFDLGECLLALDADPSVIAHYEAEARRRGVGPVVDELLALIARVEATEAVPDTDALDHAEALGDAVEALAADGQLSAPIPPPPGDATAWHVVGTTTAEAIRCAGCGTRYAPDDETADLPTCPACGTRDTWEARQDPGYRALLQAIDACDSLRQLAALGQRLYAQRLPRAQAGVAWTHYQIRKARLEAGTPLGPAARQLLAEIEAADARALPRLGAALYRRQHAPAGAAISAAEWGRLWAAYRARRPARSA
jgi:hypothetical protein